jgi:hypothetical protein
VSVRLVLDGAVMAELLGKAGPVAEHLITKTTRFQVAARGSAPVRTGCLRDSIVKRPIVEEAEGVLSMLVVCDTTPCSPTRSSYALLVHNGTKPHDIPNAFGWGHDFGIGGRFDGRFHPGTKPHPFFTENLPLFAD